MGGRPTYWPHCGLHSFKALPELGVEDHPDKFFSRQLQADPYWTKISLLPSTPGGDLSTVLLLSLPECPEHMILLEMMELQIRAFVCGLEHLAVKYTCTHPHVALLANCGKYRCLITEHRSASDWAGYSCKNRNLFPPSDLIFDLRRGSDRSSIWKVL